MSASNKLSTAVKALNYLAESHPTPKSSSEIAKKIGYNPSKLRKILSYLSKSKIVNSTRGKDGGFVLAKNPRDIDLQEVYCSVEFRPAFYLDVTRSNKKTKYNKQFNEYFLKLFRDVQDEIESKMKKISLADIINDIDKN